MSEIDAHGNIVGMDDPILMIVSDDDDPTIASFISYERGGVKYFMFIYKGEYESEIFEIPMSQNELASLPEEAFENAEDFQEAIYPEITDKFSKYNVQRMNDEEMSFAYHCMVVGARRNNIYTFGNKPIKRFEDREELEEYLESLDIIRESASYIRFIPTFESNLVDHAIRELELAGMITKEANEDDIEGSYNNLVSKSVIELIRLMSSQGHSGLSASMVTHIFDLLSKYKTLTPISDNPKEWNDVSDMMGDEPCWQNNRDPSYFSTDGGKTWYSVDDERKDEAVRMCKSILMKYVSINEVIDEHDDKTAAGVLFIANDTKNALLAKRSKDDAEAGTWSMITIPLNIVIKDAMEAKRETSKLIKEQIGNVGEFTLDEVYVNESGGFKFYNYVAMVKSEFNPTSDWETEKYQWFSFDEIINANPKKLHYGVKILKDNALEKLKRYFGK
jgi:hypothetical protein